MEIFTKDLKFEKKNMKYQNKIVETPGNNNKNTNNTNVTNRKRQRKLEKLYTL